MAQQDLNGPKVARGFVDHRCFRATKGMRAVLGASQSNSIDPLVNQPGVLACAQVARMIDAAWKSIVVHCAAATFEPAEKARPDISRQFELNGFSRLLLKNDRSGPDIGSRYEVADLDLHQVATAQLTVDRQVEQRPVAEATFAIEKEADGPNASGSAVAWRRPSCQHSMRGGLAWPGRIASVPSFSSRALIGHRVERRYASC